MEEQFSEDAAAFEEAGFVVDLHAYEGPLDVLLSLARDQKVDISRLSILTLAEQYLAFIGRAHKLRLEIAADYLVMAAWLAYLKSKLLLPEPEDDEEPSGEEMAELLAFKLERLEAFRKAAEQLQDRPQLQRDLFQRGMPEAIGPDKTLDYQDTLYDLLKAYGQPRSRTVEHTYHIERRTVISLEEAGDILKRLLGVSKEWINLTDYLLAYTLPKEQRRSVMASCFASTLERVKEGTVLVKQDRAFAEIMVRSASGSSGSSGDSPKVSNTQSPSI